MILLMSDLTEKLISRQTFFFILFVTKICVPSIAVIVKCDYRLSEYVVDEIALQGQLYECYGEFSKQCEHTPEVGAVTYNHLKGKGRMDVAIFRSVSDTKEQNFPSLPMNLGRFFPKLKVLHIPKINLERLANSDLKDFPQLECLTLRENKLTTLPGNLFQYTKQLVWIDFQKNEIEYVGEGIFKPTSKLRYALMNDLKCTNFPPVLEKQNIKSLERELKLNCGHKEPRDGSDCQLQLESLSDVE